METSVESQPYLANSDFQELSNPSGQEIKRPLPYVLLIIIFPLLIFVAFLVGIRKILKKASPM